MPVIMIRNSIGISDPGGNTTKNYHIGDVIETSQPWLANLANRFIDAGCAMQVQSELSAPETKKKRKSKKSEDAQESTDQ